MRIEVNGTQREVRGDTVAAALAELGYEGAKVATALNGQFVPGTGRADQRLQPGDRLEILAPMQGG